MNSIAFIFGGAATFVLAATLAAGVYWYTPIVPCLVELPPQHYSSGIVGPGGSRDDLCTGQRAHGYATGASANRSARMLQSGLGVGCLIVGAFGGLVTANFQLRAKRRAKESPAP